VLDQAHVRIAFATPRYRGGGTEWLWAQPLGDDLYRIDNIPLTVEGIALGDVVEARERRGKLSFGSVRERSGRSAYALYSELVDTRPDAVEEWWQRLVVLGATRERQTRRLWAVDLPPGALGRAFAVIEAGRLDGIWVYDELYAHRE
jgi:hypothetical protein